MNEVKKLSLGGWIFYLSEKKECLDKHKCGKWMHFFNNEKFAAHICEEAVAKGICVESKHTDAEEGVCCFYLNCDDMEGHKRAIGYFIENGLIRKTKTGKLYNISFKLDDQTRAGEYGPDFYSEIKLDQFVDLHTGEFI
ncbi:MAG: hypothetical protein HDR01_01655 [Lachnospiraceae bacterium]|nr:hypothetical protein [Lachnospiraceae bacterium]